MKQFMVGPVTGVEQFRDGEAKNVKFLLEVNLDEGALDADAAGELGRILRYWGGNLRHYALEAGDGSAVYDSDYREVGQWRVVAAADPS